MTIGKTHVLAIVFLSAAILLITASCATPSASTPAGAATLSNQPTGISVQGQGVVSVKPDVAEVWLGISVKAATLAAAQREASDRMNQVLAKLTSLGIAEKDIKTVRFSIFPEYDRDRSLTGYRVDNIVSVKSKALDKVGELLDGVVEAGANRVERVSFTVEDRKPLAAKAREEAMADARAKAEQLARLAGVRLGRPTLVTESGGVVSPPIPMALSREGGAFTTTTPISPGEMEVRVNVQVTYAIE
jgi:hypothetical protein